ncbi:Cyanate hydratase, partial [Arthromyces matolae]
MPESATVSSSTSPYSELPPIFSKLFEAKARKGLSFDAIGKALSKDEVWVAAAFYGQAKFSQEDFGKLSEVLDISTADLVSPLGDHWWPNRGLGPIPPTDPVIYRLYEGVLVYGHAIK